MGTHIVLPEIRFVGGRQINVVINEVFHIDYILLSGDYSMEEVLELIQYVVKYNGREQYLDYSELVSKANFMPPNYLFLTESIFQNGSSLDIICGNQIQTLVLYKEVFPVIGIRCATYCDEDYLGKVVQHTVF